MAGLVIGIDPGLADTGYAVLDVDARPGPRVVEAGLLQTDPLQPLHQRLATLHEGLAGLLDAFPPEAVAVEDLYSAYRHPRMAILMGHARGVVLLAAAQGGAPVFHYPPARIKRALTGNGRAGKAQMQRMIQQLLALRRLPEPDHVADALSVALCHHLASLSREHAG
ncbi:MAG TPA: crossover junction endodeoxyribonuclease RuvC [Bacillota bacterium]